MKCKNISTLVNFNRDLEVVVHASSLVPMQFSDELFLHFRESTDYILSVGITQYGETTSTRLCVLPSRGIVVERSPVWSFAVDCPLSQYLGFKLMLSSIFFLLRHVHACRFFQDYVVVSLALEVSRNSISLLHGSFRCARFYTLIS